MSTTTPPTDDNVVPLRPAQPSRPGAPIPAPAPGAAATPELSLERQRVLLDLIATFDAGSRMVATANRLSRPAAFSNYVSALATALGAALGVMPPEGRQGIVDAVLASAASFDAPAPANTPATDPKEPRS